MDHESNVSRRLDILEYKSKLAEYLLDRVKTLTQLTKVDEYEYCEVNGRISELQELLTFLKTNLEKTNENE
jgi:hypothetical protein